MFEYNKSKKPKSEFNTESSADTPRPPADWKGVGNTAAPSSFPMDSAPAAEDLYGAVAEPAEVPGGMAARNVLNSDVSVVGILRFSNELLVDGSVEGEITSDGILTVGINATIIANESKNKVAIRTKSAIIHGKVAGDVEVDDLVELAPDSELIGDITAARLIIHDGAVFIGRSAVGVASSDFVNLTKKTSAKNSDTKAKPAKSAAGKSSDAKSSAMTDLLA